MSKMGQNNSCGITEKQFNSYINRWTHRVPKSCVKKLVKEWGHPTGVSKHSVIWEIEEREPYISIEVKDELVKPHNYFIYTTISMKKIKTSDVSELLKITKNLIVDVRKQEITVRTNSLELNDVILSFVIDIIEGTTTKTEYQTRIKKKIITQNYLSLSKNI